MKFVNKNTGVIAEVKSEFLVEQYKKDNRYKEAGTTKADTEKATTKAKPDEAGTQ